MPTETHSSFLSHQLAPACPTFQPFVDPFRSSSDWPPYAPADPNVSELVAIAGYPYGRHPDPAGVHRGFSSGEPLRILLAPDGGLVFAFRRSRLVRCRLHESRPPITSPSGSRHTRTPPLRAA